ncbi:MAG: HNH endonuclease [Clostridiales bacterium]|jgi:predicted kinase|nr:HNH endonuclease [Clostridiales bacterium]
MIDPIHAFYCSKEFTGLSRLVKLKSGGRCARCGGIFPLPELRAHHVQEITLANVCDPHVTLDAGNIEVLCHDCHNREHKRFAAVSGARRVFVVWGAPCSGKSSYVAEVATHRDLIIDLDRLHLAVCNCGLYDKPDATKAEAFALRDKLLERIRYRAGKWEDAYIIGGYPDRTEREQLARDYGAELIHIDTPREECVRRACADERRAAVRDTVVKWVEGYYARLTF